jgi:glycosyltransferase involved in cell wall biosynthesis
MNVLFVLYGDFTANSALHVAHLANHLIALGADCTVAVPAHPESIRHLGQPRFRGLDYATALADGTGFADGRGPDIVHAWTTRENVRRFCHQIAARYPGAQLVVHLEDHELHLAEARLGRPLDELLALPEPTLDRLVPPELTHPRRGPRFLHRAVAVTVIVERLRELAPHSTPVEVLWPAADAAHFRPRPVDSDFRRALGLQPDHTVLVYHGNVHEANAAEVRSLYLAVALLNRRGQPTQLVRTGRDFAPFLGADDSWVRPWVIDLGLVTNYQHLPAILALADVFVQPGQPGRFNDYRFPSKLPEFFALGRPVVLPRTNLGLVTRHLEDAYVLPRADADAIAAAITHLRTEPALAEKLAAGALAFSARHFSWPATAARLLRLYAQFAPAAAAAIAAPPPAAVAAPATDE